MPKNRYSGDVFGKNISDSTANNADIAGHYPYSPERWRFFETDITEVNRIFLQYADDARYEHQAFNTTGSDDVHTIKPNAGDTLIFKTAERFRYVVGYESMATWAFAINQQLQSGDELLIGPNDLQDGWALRFSGDLGPLQCEFVQLRSGSEMGTNKKINLSKEITKYTRFEWRYAWYEIMGCILSQSYNFDNWQLGDRGSDGNRNGPAIGNTPLTAKITASATTTDLEIYLGSCSWQTKGDINSITRSKVFNTGALAHSGGGQWEPLYVVRKDPKRKYIQGELTQLKLADFSANDNAFTLAVIMSKEKIRDVDGNALTDSNFSTPDEISSKNSIFEFSTDIAQFPNSNGTITTSTADPGGYQIGYSSLYNEAGAGVEAQPTTLRMTKRKVNNDDYLVVLGKTATAGDLTSELLIEQSW